MNQTKISIPKGTRDFGPEIMVKRNFILKTIQSIFEKFGFLPIETPSIENLSVLTGKYGEDGDKLLFKVLNSGDYLSKTNLKDYKLGSAHLTQKISKKGLRYDLTVPLARFVVMNRNEITLPFRRYQIQPVWRADRPQKGRYQEFYQCDADIIGTNSAICEAEIILIISESFAKLGITDYLIKINHRGILKAIVEQLGVPGKENEYAIAIDKLDKIGTDKVLDELKNRGFEASTIEKLRPIISLSGSTAEKVKLMEDIIGDNKSGKEGLASLHEIFEILDDMDFQITNLQFDQNLARGLSYYTGVTFEVIVNNVSIGSVCGGGRYDNLTGVFGMPDIPGTGISFGIDRIYDVMQELDLFPKEVFETSKVLITNFDKESQKFALRTLSKIRAEGINCEIYPDHTKLKKQFNYADKKLIPYVLMIGPEEIQSGEFSLKNMATGEQVSINLEGVIEILKQ